MGFARERGADKSSAPRRDVPCPPQIRALRADAAVLSFCLFARADDAPCAERRDVDEEECEETVFHGVSDVYVQSIMGAERNPADDDVLFKELRLPGDMPVLVDECGDAAVHIARDGVSVFDGAVAYQVQMLSGGCAYAEPAVVRDVHHQTGTFAYGFADLASVNRFVADERRPGIWLTHRNFLACDKVSFPEVHVIQNRNDIVERNAFAEGDEVHLIVAQGLAFPGGEKEAAVVKIERARIGAVAVVGEGADEYPGVRAFDHLAEVAPLSGTALQKVRNGRFGEHEQVHLRNVHAVLYELPGLRDDGIVIFRAPLVRLVNARLHEGERGRVLGIGDVERLCFGLRENDVPVNEERGDDDGGERDENFAPVDEPDGCAHVAGDDDRRVTEDADERERLQKFQMIPEHVAEMAPREAEFTDAPRHFEPGVEEREEREEYGAAFDLDVAGLDEDECGESIVGAEERDEEE